LRRSRIEAANDGPKKRQNAYCQGPLLLLSKYSTFGIAGGNRMSTSLIDDREAASRRNGGVGKLALFAAKLVVTGACFWYVSRQVDMSQLRSVFSVLEFRWVAFSILAVMLQIPLVAVRWRSILEALAPCGARMTRVAIIAVTAIAIFFGQVLPSVAGEGVRAWLLVRLGCDWRNALTSVIIDRSVGIGLLVAFGFVVLLLPSGLTALGGYRDLVLVAYGALLLAGVFALALAPAMAPVLAGWRYSRWLAILAADTHRVLLGAKSPLILAMGCLVHALTILVVWSLGRAQGLALPVTDAAVLFTVMVGVTIVPISIGGWGLRELAVVSLLSDHGVAPANALLFSVEFGLTLAVASLPGALAWLLYPISPVRSVTRGHPPTIESTEIAGARE
jgi:glycosyltransferase 2 family protein